MEKLENRIIVIIALVLLTGAFVFSHRVIFGEWKWTGNLELPLKVGQWSGKEEVVTERVLKLLEADTVLIRRYFRGNDEIWFAVVYYKDNQVGFHSPEACFGGLGRKLFDKENTSLYIKEWERKVNIHQLHYKGPEGEKVLYYFFMIDDFVADSEIKIRMRMLWEQLKFKRPGVALFELYAPVGSGGIDQAKNDLKDFLTHLIPQLPDHLK